MEYRVNPKTVEYIEVYNEKKGFYFENMDSWFDYKWLPEHKETILFGLITIAISPAKFYFKGDYESFGWKGEPTDKVPDNHYQDVNGWLWSKPMIKIFAGGKCVTNVFFSNLEELEEHVLDNYGKSLIKYKK